MHDFWTLPEDSPERFNDMVNFFKVCTLTGLLLLRGVVSFVKTHHTLQPTEHGAAGCHVLLRGRQASAHIRTTVEMTTNVRPTASYTSDGRLPALGQLYNCNYRHHIST